MTLRVVKQNSFDQHIAEMCENSAGEAKRGGKDGRSEVTAKNATALHN